MTLNSFVSHGMDYRIWKGLHKVNSACRGESDLDVYIPAIYKKQAEEILSKKGWKRFFAPVEFDGISHWFFYEHNSGKFYHFHIYYLLRTGPTYSKHFLIKGFDKLSTRYEVINEMRIFDTSTNLKIHKTRLRLKKHSFLGRLFIKREVTKHRREEAFILNFLSEDKKVDNSPLDYGVYQKLDNFTVVKNIFIRFRSKVLRKRKKLPRGICIAMIGTDGAGKSTLAKESVSILSNHLDTYHASFGRPSFSILTAPLWAARMIIQTVKPITIEVQESAVAGKTSLLKAIYHIFVALERLYVCRKIASRVSKGWCVIVDRCPSMQIGQMDAPKICGKRGIINLLSKLEFHIYSRMTVFDLAIKFEVELPIVMERNRKRVKTGKESDFEVTRRYKQFEDFVPYSKQQTSVNGNGELGETLKIAVLTIYNSLPVYDDE